MWRTWKFREKRQSANALQDNRANKQEQICKHQLHKAKDGSVIMEKDKIMQRWTEYIFDLYEDKKRGTLPIIKRNGYAQDITGSEVKTAMEKMKPGKAVGNDQIAYEMTEAVGTFGISKVRELANIIYTSG